MHKMMMMAVAALATLGVKADVAFSDVIVRQFWPFKSNVGVDCVVSGVNEPTSLKVQVSDGGEPICEIPDVAFVKGQTVSATGKHHLEFDPMLVPELRDRGVINDFRVSLSVGTPDRVMYVVFDLTKPAYAKGQMQYVTESALQAGTWGAWEQDATSGSVIWTGIALGDTYKQTRIAFRRMPAGSFLNNNNLCSGSVTLSRDYFFSVFLVTESQYARLKGLTPLAESSKPQRNFTYEQLRGATDGAAWPTVRKVDADSELAAFSTRLGTFSFDLPTSAQWEYAVRAGADGKDGDGNDRLGFIGYSEANLTEYAWYQPNSGWIMQPVGTLKPNPWGIYDMFGNAWCMCCDWCTVCNSTSTGLGTDPGGAYTGSKRLVRGGCVTTQESQKGYVNAIFAYGAIEPNKTDDTIGFRMVFQFP